MVRWRNMVVPLVCVLPGLSLSTAGLGQTGPTAAPPHLRLPLPFSATQAPQAPNTVLPPLPRESKRQWAQLFMLFNPVSVRDLLNVMAHKMPAKPGLDVDQVAEAVIARAERHGFLLVNRYRMWRELEARTGTTGTPKVEVISLCDPLISRAWLDYAPGLCVMSVRTEPQFVAFAIQEAAHQGLPVTLHGVRDCHALGAQFAFQGGGITGF